MTRIQECYRIAPNRVWRTYPGGMTLDKMEGLPSPRDGHFPEDWLISTTRACNAGREDFQDEGISAVMTEGGARMRLTDLLAAHPDEILGAAHCRAFGASAGFLLKFLDSSMRLHMQCHPSRQFARRHLHATCGKTEGYCILDVRPDCEGYLYLGFQRRPAYESFRQAILHQDTAEMLSHFDRIPVRPGDVFFVPGGVPHAIGEGVLMVEFMEPTDFAVRIEFERGGYVLPESARFMDRDVDFALSMFDFTARGIEETRDAFFIRPRMIRQTDQCQREMLFDERTRHCFRAERITVRGKAELTHEALGALIVLKGCGVLECGDTALAMSQYDRVLLPDRTRRFRISGELEALLAMPPKPR